MSVSSSVSQQWYRHGPDCPWRCCHVVSLNPMRYQRPAGWLAVCEALMTGEAQADVLWRNNDRRARRMVWC